MCAEAVGIEESMGANPNSSQTYKNGVEKKQGAGGAMPEISFGLFSVIVNVWL